MEVTRQLLTERAGKTGLSRIQLTFCWDGQRLRLGAGQKCLPKDWDARREQLKAKTGAAGTYVDTVNRVLDTYAAAAHAAHHDAQLQGQRLTPAQLKAEVLRRYAELGEQQAGLLPIPAPPALEDYYTRWLGEQARRTNLRTGQRLSKTYLDSLANSLSVLLAFAKATKHELTLSGMNQAFYQQFQAYFFEQRGQGLNTFGKHVHALKTFLTWAEDNDLGVNPKYRKFEAPRQARGDGCLDPAGAASHRGRGLLHRRGPGPSAPALRSYRRGRG
jgi:hypothetical protein